MKKQKKGGASGGNWMDTYGDMVTLLLCFFVLLYSISAVDQEKFKNLVASLNPEAIQEEMGAGEGTGMENEVKDAPAEESDTTMQEMYNSLTEALQNMGLEDNVQIIGGEDFNFVVFKDRVFFDGDSYVLKEEGKQAIHVFCDAISPYAGDIYEIQIFGHTSQARADQPNDAVSDRMLAADRAAQVASFIQNRNIIAPGKVVSLGFGQHRPIASFATAEDRSRNRRVEILITENDSVERSLTEYYEQIYGEDVANMQPDR